MFVAVGGGGLISGIASYLKEASPSTKIIGCSPFNNACMGRSIEKGHILKEGEFEENGGATLSEGTAGGVELNSFTLQVC